jgi:hypothetical protein
MAAVSGEVLLPAAGWLAGGLCLLVLLVPGAQNFWCL